MTFKKILILGVTSFALMGCLSAQQLEKNRIKQEIAKEKQIAIAKEESDRIERLSDLLAQPTVYPSQEDSEEMDRRIERNGNCNMIERDARWIMTRKQFYNKTSDKYKFISFFKKAYAGELLQLKLSQVEQAWETDIAPTEAFKLAVIHRFSSFFHNLCIAEYDEIFSSSAADTTTN